MDFGTAAVAVTAAVGSAVVFHPLDTILTLRQASIKGGYILPFRQYWRGVTVSAVMSTPAFMLYLVSYRQAKKDLGSYFGTDSAFTYIFAGIVAEVTSSVFFTPMEVIKGRMQLRDGSGIASTSKLVKKMYETEGLRSFFRGYFMNLVIYTPNTVFYWYVYEHLKKYIRRQNAATDSTKELSTTQYAVASSLATAGSETVSNFFDVVKTRQQLALSDEVKLIRPDDRNSLLTVAKNLIKEAGLLRALFRGLHIRLMYALPVGALTMTIVESIKTEDDDCDDYDL
ncbi:mitochondrial carrier domain-containing protein [Lipomyces arxii]|uniref:mitochondrial carrier domain-containing protein n=1 Tax=Lipomyces arxii TaxID=56418 RepID=UPI0034CDCF71